MKNSYYLCLTVDDESNIVLQKTKFNIKSSNKYNFLSCPICLNEFSNNESKEDFMLLKCCHKYCYACIEASRKKNHCQNFMCPTCKHCSNSGFIVDANNNIKNFLNLSKETTGKDSKDSNSLKKCSKCNDEIK